MQCSNNARVAVHTASFRMYGVGLITATLCLLLFFCAPFVVALHSASEHWDVCCRTNYCDMMVFLSLVILRQNIGMYAVVLITAT